MKKRLLAALLVLGLLLCPIMASAAGNTMPKFTTNLKDQTLERLTDKAVMLEVAAVAESGDPLGYQWYRNGSVIPSRTTTICKAEQDGAYHVVVTNLTTNETLKSNTTTITRGTAPYQGSASVDIRVNRRKDTAVEKHAAVVADAKQPISETVLLGNVYAAIDRAAADQGVITLIDAKQLEQTALDILRRLQQEKGLPDRIFADTIEENRVQTRLSLVLSGITAPFSLGLRFADSALCEKIASGFSNRILVVEADQKSYGQTVEMMVDAKGLTGSLAFYRYDPQTNHCTPITVSDVSLDEMGFLHFKTNQGGILVISQGELAAK